MSRRLLRSEKGQASLMVGLMMLTFLFLFCFSVNIGMLVNAKINLQNAADLAAYTGAAVQARQLNQIALLNYEMRRQYKKFIFRYYVIGNMAQKSAQKNVSTSDSKTPRYWSPDGITPGSGKPFNVPVVCMIFNSNDNYCQLPMSPKIIAPPQGSFDAINNALIQQLKGIEDIRQQNCERIGFTNQMTLRLWLWNVDPSNQALLATGGATAMAKDIPLIAQLADSLGLVPKNILLRKRIDTLNQYINRPAELAVDSGVAQNLKNSPDPAARERTIQAFYSALYTLGDHTFPTTTIRMDEILPTTLLTLKDVKTRFDAYAMKYTKVASGGVASSIDAKDCVPSVVPEQMRQDLVVGVSKDPKTLTYYAVRLKATAKLLFSPWGDLDMKAYAAAQPFGSRIGPVLQETDWVRTGANPAIPPDTTVGTFVSLLNQVPNLPVRRNDSTGTGQGWDTNEVIGTMFGSSFNDPGITQIDANGLHKAYQIAMSPNPWETGYYQIPNDLDPGWPSEFDGQRNYVFWAPVVPPEKTGSIDAEISSLLDDLIAETTPDAMDFKNAVKQQVNQYLTKLKSGQGEAGETFNTYRMPDPFYLQSTAPTPPALIKLPEWIALSRTGPPGKILTSWNHPSDAAYRDKEKLMGRTGYSVKFVSFSSLSTTKSNSTPKELWTNEINADDEAAADLPWLKH